jgi:hypothetical protein
MAAKPAGYSGTPLSKKLGFKPGTTVALINAPAFMKAVVTEVGAKAKLAKDAKAVTSTAAAHIFVTEATALKSALNALLKVLDRDGMIWVSWPKKASKVTTDITEDTIRKLALPLDLVDVKVCAVDDVWSGLKLMIRKEKR